MNDRRPRTILLVEDNDGLRSAIQTQLERLGHDVIAVGDGATALDVAEARPDGIDLLLIDVELPVMMGPEVARRLGSSQRGMRLLFISGRAPEVGETWAETPGSFLEKPFTLTDLKQRLSTLLADGEHG
jgi:CheY-like chemotaxis protein